MIVSLVLFSIALVFSTPSSAQVALSFGYHPPYHYGRHPHVRAHCATPPPPPPPAPRMRHHHPRKVWVPAHWEMTPQGRIHIRGHWARA